MQLLGKAPLLTIRVFAKVAVVISVLFCADSLSHIFSLSRPNAATSSAAAGICFPVTSSTAECNGWFI